MEPLVSTTETRLADGGLLAALLGLVVRFAVWFAVTRENPLLDSQLIAGGLLIAALNFAGLLLPRSYAGIPVTLGLLGWLYGLSLLPRYFFWGLGERPQWLGYAAVGLAALSFIARGILARRWSQEIYGKGWAWIDNWAQARSLRARVLARRALVTLGYRRAKDAAEAQ